ncbi:hypothetical protein BAU67_001899 [Escherichia coli]|nr:hypothetical protein [Escherichia coli]EMB7054140.1 hypothetical protein [Escherichia coli]
MSKRYDPHEISLDFVFGEYTVEFDAIVQLPDYTCQDSDIDYYGIKQVTNITLYHKGYEVVASTIPACILDDITAVAYKELEEYLLSAETVMAFEEETGGF